MVRVSVLNDALKSMYNAEKRGKRQVLIKTFIQSHYQVCLGDAEAWYANFSRPRTHSFSCIIIFFHHAGYIGEFEFVDDHWSGKIVFELNGRLKKCGVIGPRFDIGVKDIEEWTARLLPSKQPWFSRRFRMKLTVIWKSKMISHVPIHLSIYSPNEGQQENIVQDIENMVRSYVKKPNSIILAISHANQDIATSDAIKLAREVDPSGEQTFGVLTMLDLMDKGNNAVDVNFCPYQYLLDTNVLEHKHKHLWKG